MPKSNVVLFRIVLFLLIFLSVSYNDVAARRVPTPIPQERSKTLFEEIGVTPPETYDELLDICKKIREDELAASSLMIILLNYLQMSLMNIKEYNDRIVLDGEYRNVLANIQLSVIYDQEMLAFLQKISQALKPFILSPQERKTLVSVYDEEVSQRLYQAYSQQQLSLPGDNSVSGGAALVEIDELYKHYRRHIRDYHQRLDANLWTLQPEVLDTITELQKQFPALYWRFIQAYHFPDTLQLTEEQTRRFLLILRESDQEKRLRQLAERQESFLALPTLWYEYAKLTLQLRQPSVEILAVYEELENARVEIFREDHEYAQMLMEKILLKQKLSPASVHHDQQQQQDQNSHPWDDDLETLTKQCPEDWRKNLFAALQYISLENYPTASSLIQRNLDNGKDKSLHNRVTGEIYAMTNNEQQMVKLLEDMFADPHIRYQDILYLLGYVREGAFLQKLIEQFMKPGVAPITFTLDCASIYGDDVFIIRLPSLWSRTYPKEFRIYLSMFDDEQVINPEEVEVNENRIKLTFTAFLVCNEFYDYNIQKRFRLNVSDEMQTTSFVINAHLNDTEEKEIVFDKEELAINGTCYSISEKAWDKLPQCKF